MLGSRLLFRSFALGLLAACFALLVMRPTVELRVAHPPHDHVAHAATAGTDPWVVRPALPAPAPSIIDVAPGITATQLAALLRLAPGERIISVDDVEVAGDLGAGILLASRDLRSRQFIDLEVTGPAGERRVLVLLH